MRKLLIAAVAAVLLVGLIASPASAAKPVVVLDEVVENVDFLEPDASAECGFDVFVTDMTRVKITDYFDNDGNFLRALVQLRGTAYWFSDVKALPAEHWGWNGTFDAETVTFTRRGNIFNIHDRGPVLTDSGRLIIDEETGDILFQAGNHPLLDEGFGALCDALS